MPYLTCIGIPSLLVLFNIAHNPGDENPVTGLPSAIAHDSVSLMVLGTVQDGGSPHIGCTRDCCKELFIEPDETRKVVALGLIDAQYHKHYLIEATPDLPTQWYTLLYPAKSDQSTTPDAIFLTHAHIGHYTGLMYFGKESIHTKQMPVYVMPRMKKFLEINGPWSLLVTNQNISLQELENKREIQLTPNLQVTPFLVPHRDEFSETIGFRIAGPNKTALFIPDIDKWEKWDKSIVKEIANVDYAFLDGTFYDAEEIGYRDIAEIPHPLIIESMELFAALPAEEKQKVYFIHFNHTNPALNIQSRQAKEILDKGFNLALYGQCIAL